MKIEQLDLNLLAALRALLEERNITRAAKRLGISAPGASGALTKLRAHFDDPLLIRDGAGWVVSPFAAVLLQQVVTALHEADIAFSLENKFDPGTSQRRFVMEVCDWALAVFLEPIGRWFAAAAPNASLKILHAPSSQALDSRKISPDVDLYLSPAFYGDEFRTRRLFRDRNVLFVATPRMMLGPLDALRWIAIDAGPYASDMAFQLADLHPRVTVLVNDLHSLACSVGRIGDIAVLPERYALASQHETGGQVVSGSFELGTVDQAMMWHSTLDEEPGNRWLRELVAISSNLLEPSDGTPR